MTFATELVLDSEQRAIGIKATHPGGEYTFEVIGLHAKTARVLCAALAHVLVALYRPGNNWLPPAPLIWGQAQATAQALAIAIHGLSASEQLAIAHYCRAQTMRG